VVNEPLDRAARERELDAVTELHRVNLSPENRFEASPLRGNSKGTFALHWPGHICAAVECERELDRVLPFIGLIMSSCMTGGTSPQ
jgi:hypothetical protein